MTLKELTTSGTNGIIVSGEFKKLTTGTSQTISLSSSVENTASTQDSLVGNSYTINIAPYTSGDTKAFSCKLHEEYIMDYNKSLAQNLIDSEWLWQSGLEGDGYRYVGTGEYQCSYNNGNYIITSGIDGCPSSTLDSSSYKTLTLDSNGQTKLSTAPNNFICFGTTSKSDCTSNQDKYMYRVLGVFPDSNGEQHVKLIKYKQLGRYAWHSDNSVDTSWENSDMYKGLNGSYFLTNTTYDYLQNNTWLNKIFNWTWSAVNTQTGSNSGPTYYNVSPKEVYLHEMNRSTKTNTIGNWTTPLAKIGLMYVSDYELSLGSSTLTLTTGTYVNRFLLKSGWIHQSNNDTTKETYEWPLSRLGASNGFFFGWVIDSDGFVRNDGPVSSSLGVRPVFYLNTGETYSSGLGTLEDPFIIEE